MNDPLTQHPLYKIGDSLGTFLLKVVREEVTNVRVPWVAMPKANQDAVLDRMRGDIDKAVKLAVRRILSADLVHVEATLNQITIKDGVKATLTFDRAEEALDALMHKVGGQVVLVPVSPAVYTEGMESVQGDADQNPLPLEEGE